MTRMTQRNNSISGLARLVRTTALGVAIATSTSSAGQPAADRFVAGNPASLKRAEEPGLRHLREAPTLLAGVELGRARGVEIDALGRAHIRVQLDYVEGVAPFRPVVFVDAIDGAVVWSYDNLQAARNRRVYDVNNSTALPVPLARFEGGAASADVDVEASYDRMGSTYDCYLVEAPLGK